MRKILFSLMIVSFLIGALPAFSYIIDGNLDDWGVTPFVNWAPSSPTADFKEEDNIAHPKPENPWTDEPLYEVYDLEAMYFDDDKDYLYFGIVTSNNYSSFQWAREDLAIDLDNDGYYEIGADIASREGENPLPLNTLATRDVYNVSKWNTYRNAPYSVSQGTKIGTFEIFNRYAGPIEPPPGSGYLFRPGTFILEGRISRLLFGDIACGQNIRLFFSRITCLKDYIAFSATCNGNCGGVIPEPTTLLLLGSGLMAIARLRRKQK